MKTAAWFVSLILITNLASTQTVDPKPDFAELLNDLKSKNSDVAWKALSFLTHSETGPRASKAVPVLEGLLASDDVLFRESVARLLLRVAGEDHESAQRALEQMDSDNRLIEGIWDGDLGEVLQTLAGGASVVALLALSLMRGWDRAAR